jgi:hypothetical protein
MDITDPHLTAEHHELLDIIWAIDDHDALVEWADTLCPRLYKMASTLVYLVQVELIDSLTEDFDSLDCFEANIVIDHILSPGNPSF